MLTRVSTSILIDRADKLAVFSLLRRLEEYPRFMPDVRRVTVLESTPAGGASQWDVDIEGCPLRWKERDSFREDESVFEFKSFEGDFDLLNGRWEIVDVPGGLEARFTIEYEVGIPVIEDIIGDILAEKVKRNATRMLEGLKSRAEELLPRSSESVARSAVGA